MGARASIIIKLDTKHPIEIGDFVAEFTSVADQYAKFIQQNYPDLAPGAKVYVKEIRKGSFIVELLPFVPFLMMGSAELMHNVEQINAVNEFVRTYGTKIKAYFKKNGKVPDATRSDLKDFMDGVTAIANDPDGKATIQAAVFEDQKKKVRAAISFNSREASRGVENIERHRLLEKRDAADRPRVLMAFRQANVKDSPVGKRTGERVVIEEISEREHPLIYASELAEQHIKHEIREAEDNLFKKGFVVDVNIMTKAGKPIAYRVTNLHQVIDLA
jgi:hypothetical protein